MARLNTGPEGMPATASLVRAIHAAAVNVGDWPDVLERMRAHLDARVVTLGRHEFVTGSDSLMFESPGSRAFSGGMAEFSARNPWFLSSEDYVPGRVMTGDELISHADLRRTDFYRGFLQPRGLLHLLCGVVDRRPRCAHVLAAYRAETQAPFGAREKAELVGLLDHVTLSLQSQWRWQEANDLAQALLGLSDHDANPTILVTTDGEPIYSNPAARLLLERRQGLQLDDARLVAASPGERRLLSEAIARVARDGTSKDGVVPEVLTLANAPSQPPVVVVVRAAGQAFCRQVGASRGLVMLAVRGSHSGHNPATCVFARQYELTAAQSKVSALVFAGQSLSTIAQSLNLSENTVRSHLKQIFQKTDTHGQMELVHLHARVCPTLP
ncbi:DNA-binding protein with HTH domain [Burkholderiales bacterium JOSHI_001]|nr:DNA-binding protein with HTH domain [Burkholderiales bacterium JOSHI_001]